LRWSQGDGIFLLKDFARYCENDKVCRRLRELAEQFRTARRSIVITAGAIHLPPELSGESAAFELGLPGADELLAGVKQTLADLNRESRLVSTLDAAGLQKLAANLSGLPFAEAMRTLRRCVLEEGGANPALLDSVLETKREVLRGEGLLESIRRDASFVDIAGLGRLRDWIAKRKSALSPEGQRFGLVPPKGILITGVQGCGKSLAARAVAGEWGFELARLDAGALYDKFVGESEKRLRKALDLAQKMSPLVLWIDEIEKAFRLCECQRRCGRGPLAAPARHASDLDAGPRVGRLPGRDVQQYFRASAGNAAQGALRRNLLRGPALACGPQQSLRAPSEKTQPRPASF
jgi:hypothetical protein